MNFVLGSLSLIQILCLPGAILMKFFKLRRGLIQAAVFIFGLSLIFNCTWVVLLTILKINYSVLHYILFALELGLFLWLYRDNLLSQIENLSAKIHTRLIEALNNFKDFFQKEAQETTFSRILKSLVTIIFFIWAISSLLWVSKLLVTNLGTVFKEWDAVVSWNTWAGQWFNNTIPSPRRYSQLIPANFSITYSYMRSTDIQVFAKSIMPLFTIFTWLLIFDLAFEYKNFGMFIGIVILRYMTKKFLGAYIGEGYVDVALLFFSFLTVYSLLKGSLSKTKRTRLHYLYLGAIFAAGTALTKQNGLLVFAFYPVLATLLLTDHIDNASIWERVKFTIKPVLLGLLILSPWYLLNESRILMGLNNTNVEFLMSADRHDGRSYWERAARAIGMLEIYKYLYILVLATLPLIPKKFRQIGLITIFPYTIIWIFLFSIYIRNLAMVFPFLALIAGMGAAGLVNLTLGLANKIKVQRLRVVYLLIPLLLGIIGFSLIFTDTKLTEIQTSDQKNALLQNINKKLYAYFDEHEEYGSIMTKYPIEYLPYLSEYKISEPFSIYGEFYENFAAHPEAKYFLVWDKYADEDVAHLLDSFEANDVIDLHFKQKPFRFYKIIDREAILDTPPK